MKKIYAILFVSTFSIYFSFSQNPLLKQWDKRFGGTGSEEFHSYQQTSDGGFILAGGSSSGIGGDRTEASQGSWDYWIIKIDSIGNKQWDHRFGGTDYDILYTSQQTSDGGYLLGGISGSGIGGDKTQPSWGNEDYWIVKTDSLGNKQWDKRYGGSGVDELYSLRQTSDQGYILGGYSYSGISGDKTQPSWGNGDYWIVKIDSLGNILWDKRFGGTGDDLLYSLIETNDGGYMLGGVSLSGISGDKTQPSWGNADHWIIKIDSIGNKQWDKDFGGTNGDELHSIQQTTDGGYVLAGPSVSGVGGDKTQPSWGLTDYWIVKTDSLGIKQWDKDFGGTFDDLMYIGNVISQTSDEGYLIAGVSYSPMSGDKTENNLGVAQSWILKTDSLGNKQWDKTIFTTSHDNAGYAIQTKDGCYLMGNWNDAGVGGYKTQPTWGGYDYWVVKFCDTSITPAFVVQGTPLCPGTCTSFSNLSTNATSYQWFFTGAIPDTSTAVNPQSICYNTPGSYDVTLIATNANGSDTLTLANYITVFPYPQPQGILQSGDTLFANIGAVSYQWYFNGNIISAATNYFYVAPASGDYNVVCSDGNGCEVEAVIFNVVASTQVTFGNGVMEVFPNPVHEKLEIRNLKPEAAATISIYNMFGEKVLEKVIAVSDQQLNLSFLQSGIYFLQVETGAGVFQRKLVKL